MTTLFLARHGETDWNRDGRFQGHADPPLNDAGRRQAEHLAEELADEPPEAVYASDLRRAFETAEVIGARFGLPVGRAPNPARVLFQDRIWESPANLAPVTVGQDPADAAAGAIAAAARAEAISDAVIQRGRTGLFIGGLAPLIWPSGHAP